MATLVGTQSNVMDAATSLLELEYDSIELYEAVINRLQNDQYKKMISLFKQDHEDHIKRISDILKKNDVEFTKGPDGKQVLNIALVALNKLMGGDIDILKVMVPAEEDNITAYDRMLQYDDLPNEYATVFKKGVADETKHRDWLLSVIEG